MNYQRCEAATKCGGTRCRTRVRSRKTVEYVGGSVLAGVAGFCYRHDDMLRRGETIRHYLGAAIREVPKP